MIAPSPADVAAAYETLAAYHRAQIANAPASRAEWTAQKGSPLGNRRHIEAVRRRVAEGADGARIVGRRYLLSAEALEAELGRVTRGRTPTSKQAAPEPVDELAHLRAKFLTRGRAAA